MANKIEKEKNDYTQENANISKYEIFVNSKEMINNRQANKNVLCIYNFSSICSFSYLLDF